MTIRTRFAPSPTGPLHLGHAYSALVAHRLAEENGGEFLLRIEDIDQSRSRPHWEDLIYQDLKWLGLTWEDPVMRQSERAAAYQAALDELWGQGLLYACTCNRKDILTAASAPQEGHPHIGPDGIIYPGTCRVENAHLSGPRPQDTALRLNVQAASARIGAEITFTETGSGPHGEAGQQRVQTSTLAETVGDIVVARRDMGTSYHLAVVIDDAAQAISHVVRGQDLFDATQIHVLLQKLLRLPTPTYHHHRLIRDDSGKRLAKRDDARAISKYRDDGFSPQDIARFVGLD